MSEMAEWRSRIADFVTIGTGVATLFALAAGTSDYSAGSMDEGGARVGLAILLTSLMAMFFIVSHIRLVARAAVRWGEVLGFLAGVVGAAFTAALFLGAQLVFYAAWFGATPESERIGFAAALALMVGLASGVSSLFVAAYSHALHRA